MSIAMRLANRTSTVPDRVGDKAIDPAIVTNDWAPVFLFDRAAKRAFDIVTATVGLILFSPMFLLVSIAIKIDSRGPVFRRQMRHGYNNENIPLLKFRTTVVSLTEKSTSIVTRVGGVLRRTGIDGLPQLINVLRGEMSIVGPSPYVAALNNIFAEQISLIQQRHRLVPGITGWAQVNGCCGESNNVMRRRIEFDRYYIDNWSLLFDIKVILMTLFSKNAYLN
jgi:lipopolysaccharide/colanic/teichoic acid biosynthesis glycosyltransferase